MPEYTGWVPNVAGRLSFTLAGLSNHPSPVIFKGDLEDAGTYFIGYQKRNLSDTSIPILSNWIITKNLVDRFVYKKDGNLYFVCYMRHWPDEDKLSGKVLLFKRSDWPNVRTIVRDAMHSLNIWSDIDLRLDQTLGDKIRQEAVAVSRFAIIRKGTIVINSEKLPTKEETVGFSDIEQTICSQFYFFIRDLLHKHKFHSPFTDTILDIYPDDTNWKESVNFSLSRKAIILRRNGHSEALYRALGITAYLKSFRENVMSKEEAKELDYSLQHFEESTKSAISIALQEEERKLLPWIHKISNRGLAFIAILLTITNFLGSKSALIGTQSEFVKTIFELFVDNGLSLFVVVMLVFAILRLLLPEKVRFRDKIAGNITRHAVCFRRKAYAWPELILACVLFVLGGFWLGTVIF